MKNPNNLKYKNITVSGRICVGCTTLSNFLREKLGWQHWNTGQFFRDYCQKHSLFLENTSDRPDDLSRKVDYGMRENLEKKDKQIIEAWLSGFVAQGVKGALKVLLVCEDSLRIDRFVNREGVTVEEAKRHIRKREHENAKKWTRVYEKEWSLWVPKQKQNVRLKGELFDFWHPSLYDLVIDTYSNSKEETLKKVLNVLKYGSEKK